MISAFRIPRFSACGIPQVSLFALSLMLGVAVDVSAQSSRKSAERLLEVPSLSEEEAGVFLERFRNVRLASDFVFDFNLKHIPARGRPTVYSGLLAGTWNQEGPVQRVEIAHFDSDSDAVLNTSLLIHGGRLTAAYSAEAIPLDVLTPWKPLPEESVATDSLVTGVPITAFDLQLPFVYWESYTWVTSQRVLGRPAYVYDMRPENPIQSAAGVIERVRVFVDADFAALLRAEYYDGAGDLLRQIKVLSFKQVSGQWIPKALDFATAGSREKVRFEVKAAALDQRLASELFDSQNTDPRKLNIPELSFKRL